MTKIIEDLIKLEILKWITNFIIETIKNKCKHANNDFLSKFK